METIRTYKTSKPLGVPFFEGKSYGKYEDAKAAIEREWGAYKGFYLRGRKIIQEWTREYTMPRKYIHQIAIEDESGALEIVSLRVTSETLLIY